MIEVIYKEESQETQDSEGTFGLPRNIRQIGLIGDDCRIYMEDYVYTFLVRLARSEKKPEEQAAKTAVLTGETKYRGGTLYLFIKGAIIAEDMEAAQDHIDFSVEVWEKIHQAQKRYAEKGQPESQHEADEHGHMQQTVCHAVCLFVVFVSDAVTQRDRTAASDGGVKYSDE